MQIIALCPPWLIYITKVTHDNIIHPSELENKQNDKLGRRVTGAKIVCIREIKQY